MSYSTEDYYETIFAPSFYLLTENVPKGSECTKKDASPTEQLTTWFPPDKYSWKNVIAWDLSETPNPKHEIEIVSDSQGGYSISIPKDLQDGLSEDKCGYEKIGVVWAEQEEWPRWVCALNGKCISIP